LSIEASGTLGWRKYAHATFGIEEFGMSAPANQVLIFFQKK
jgi:transketolase